MASSRMAEQLGRVLGGRYRLIAPVGTGSSAQVYLADDVTLRRRVAVKVLHPALADDDGFLRRFRAEARAAAALSHPNIMAVYDWGDDGEPYLVTEFLGGGSMRSLLDQGHRLAPAQALVVGLEAAQALDFAHRRGFVHRDVKPANLLFDEDGRLRIADFGLARALAEAAWTEPQGALVGTARYAAPEQARGETVDGKADVYSLALVIIEAVTGAVPFAADTQIATLMARLDAPVVVPEALGPLRAVLEPAGRVVPAERCDAAQLAKGLLAAARRLDSPAPLPLAGAIDLTGDHTRPVVDPTLLPPGGADRTVTTTVAEPATSTAKVTRERRRWPWVALAAVIVAVASAGGAWAWIEASTPRADVPTLVDLSEAAALEAVAGAEVAADLDWEVVVEERYFDGTDAGSVAEQDPLPGEELRDGDTLTLVVSLGPPPRTVPDDLRGLTVAQAATRLEGADLALGDVIPSAHEDVPVDRVITWSHDGEVTPDEVPKGTEVDLVVSTGPELRTIRSLVGAPEADAVAALEALRLVVTRTEAFSPTVAQGLVIGTDPGAGAQVARDSTITLVVSKGRDLVTVPDVRGQSLEQATASLRSAGFEPDQVFGRASGRADSTDPEIGSTHDRGATVDIFLR